MKKELAIIEQASSRVKSELKMTGKNESDSAALANGLPSIDKEHTRALLHKLGIRGISKISNLQARLRDANLD